MTLDDLQRFEAQGPTTVSVDWSALYHNVSSWSDHIF